MDSARHLDFEKMGSAESFYMLSYILDHLDPFALKGVIDLLYPSHRSFRMVICQWLMSGHFSSSYYIETMDLVWTVNGEPDYEAELVYREEGTEETKGPKRKREESG